MKPGNTLSIRTYTLLWIAATVVPFLILPFSFLAAGTLGISLAVLWITLMPHSCINGAFICFPLSLVQCALGVVWIARIYNAIRN